MRTILVRASLLFLGTVLVISVGSGQPPRPSGPDEKKEPPEKGDPPPIVVAKQLQRIPPTPYDDKEYTAFPDLKPLVPKEKKVVKDGITHVEQYYEGEVPLPKLPAVADDAPPLRKIQLARVKTGLAYLYRVRAIEMVVGRGEIF